MAQLYFKDFFTPTYLGRWCKIFFKWAETTNESISISELKNHTKLGEFTSGDSPKQPSRLRRLVTEIFSPERIWKYPLKEKEKRSKSKPSIFGFKMLVFFGVVGFFTSPLRKSPMETNANNHNLEGIFTPFTKITDGNKMPTIIWSKFCRPH